MPYICNQVLSPLSKELSQTINDFTIYKIMIRVDKEICPHNHVCPLMKLCPVDAITQDADGYPVIDYDLCIECETCVENCPKQAMKVW